MTTLVKYFQMSLLFLMCLCAGSCAKDTDLVSGYIINTPTHKKDVSMVFDQKVSVQVPDVDIKIHVFSTDDYPKWDKVGISENSHQNDKIAILKFE
ncbi:hypothetical protein SAMN04488009_3493 [Maribacter sedimenticola]|uniref:Uncharacterized protein n=1 Tax=Maribacter sedimenticola TaxID=228956 RepID=A0ABY1SL57_9FLAO|nr:hypothetical protein [Maribacter sedimenticola]SNR73387.1 hypothetical protein SAMN04488009_3493 [Maribacter sedimenticola]